MAQCNDFFFKKIIFVNENKLINRRKKYDGLHESCFNKFEKKRNTLKYKKYVVKNIYTLLLIGKCVLKT